jgi:hypothetical protein
MPLVFVHGVNTRRGDSPSEQKVFDAHLNYIKQHFRDVGFQKRISAPEGLAVFTPYWGDLGVKFARGLKCIPKSGVESLSASASAESVALIGSSASILDAQTFLTEGVDGSPILTLAKMQSMESAIDLLFAASTNAPINPLALDDTRLLEAQSQSALLALDIDRYVAQNSKPNWLFEVTNDEAFVSRFLDEVVKFSSVKEHKGQSIGVETLGFGSALKSWLTVGAMAAKNVVSGLRNSVVDIRTQTVRDGYSYLSTMLRRPASMQLGRFVGDVFAYMQNPRPIVERVLSDIEAALHAKRNGDNELYFVGHSFGGIILYDILSTYSADIQCDLYITVGSQVGLFAEIGRLSNQASIDAAFSISASSLALRPKAAKRWLNIFDPTDLVGFATSEVFSGTTDYSFNTNALPILSHGAYFDSPRFYARLSERVQDALTT